MRVEGPAPIAATISYDPRRVPIESDMAAWRRRFCHGTTWSLRGFCVHSNCSLPGSSTNRGIALWHVAPDDERYNERMSGKDDSMTPAGSGVKLTYDDFLLFPDDGQRHELIDGEHYVTPTPFLMHQLVVGNLYFLIRTFLEANPHGRIIGFPTDVVLSRFDVVEPDLQFVSNERAHILSDWVRGAPDLVVEVASKSTRKRDLTIKRDLYARWGVREYWFVDPSAKGVRVYGGAKDTKAFTEPIELWLDQEDILSTPLLPGLELPLAAIFKE
jgi:Uma2 family endonuclease